MARKSGTASTAGRRHGPSAAFAALVLTVTSSLLFHEAGNLLLGEATVAGVSVNLRAVSCLAHTASLVLGFALCGALRRRAGDGGGPGRFFAGCLAAQGLAWALLYLVTPVSDPLPPALAAQLCAACSTALFAAGAARYAVPPDDGAIVRAACLVPAGCIALTHVALGALELLAPGPQQTSALAGFHALLIVGALGCVLASSRRGLRLPPACPRPPAAPPSGVDLLFGRVRPIRLVLATVAAYGAVFGLLHIVPLVMPLSPSVRTVASLGGSLAAVALFLVTFRSPRDATMPLLWNRFYRLVFSLAVLTVLMVPLTSRSAFLPSLLMCFCALGYFFALVLLGCRIVCAEAGFAPDQVLARAMAVLYGGYLCGNVAGNVVHDFCLGEPALFPVMGVVVFVLLFATTFSVRPEHHAKTLWGLLPREDPHGRFSRDLAKRCDELAAAGGLTPREREVLELLAKGMRPPGISEALVVSVSTVRSHVRGVYVKLGVHSQAELAALLAVPQGGAGEEGARSADV